MEEFSFKNYVKTNIKIVRILGLWPNKDYSTEKFYMIYSLILNVFFVLIFNVTITGDILATSKSLQEFVYAANGQFILALMAGVKSFFLYRYNKLFKSVLEVEIHKTVDVFINSTQTKILHKHMGYWKKIVIVCIFVGMVNWVGSMTWPIFDKNRYALPFRCWYPFKYETPILYVLIYCHQAVASLAEPFINLHGATLTCSFLAYIAAQCDVLSNMLENLQQYSSDGSDIVLTKKLEESLIRCIRYHQGIVQYSKMIEEYFSKYLMVQFVSCCLATAFMMTNLTLKSEIDVGFIYVITLQVATWTDLYIYCLYGTEVIVRSGKIPHAAYVSNWVYASKNFKKDLLFFMHRTQTPITVYAVDFFVLSIQTFTNILRTAWSYFMLLRQLSDDNFQ